MSYEMALFVVWKVLPWIVLVLIPPFLFFLAGEMENAYMADIIRFVACALFPVVVLCVRYVP